MASQIEKYPFHDANLIGIKSDNTFVELFIRSEDKIDYAVKIHDVCSFIATPFLQGNIILDVVELDAHQLKRQLSECSPTIDRLFATYYGNDSHSKFNECKILFLNSSYGAQILCIYKGALEIQKFQL